MLQLLGVVLGAIIGGSLLKFGGLVAGAMIGWLLTEQLRQKALQQSMQRDLERVQDRLSELRREQRLGQLKPRVEPVQETPPAFTWEVPPKDQERSVATKPYQAPNQIKPDVEPVASTVRQSCRPENVTVELQPSAFEQTVSNLFTGGNLLVKLGVVILFFGVSFLVKYAVQLGFFPIELRLIGTAIGGGTLLVTGWLLRGRRTEYALVLQGGGVGILYLTTFAAFRLYALVPAIPAFGLLITISIACSLLAVMQNSRSMALFGISGGFVAPFLASVGTGEPALLFGYYSVLNAGVITIAWFRSWRSLNLAGFLFTFLLSAIWGARFYHPTYFTSVEPFLILFFLMYLGVSVLFSLRQPPDLRGYIDATLVFGTPIASFLLQSLLVGDYRYGMALTALSAGLCYLAVAGLLWRRDPSLHSLCTAFAAVGAILLTLALPLAFDGRITSAAWALEGAAMVWVSFRMNRPLVRASGYLLQFLSGAAFLFGLSLPSNALPMLNSIYLGTLMVSVAGLFSAYLLWQNRQRTEEWEQPLEYLLIGWGLLWWFGGGQHELVRHIDHAMLHGAGLLFVALSALVIRLTARFLQWRTFSWPSLLLLPVMVAAALVWLPAHPLAHGGWFAWPVALLAGWWLVYEHEDSMAVQLVPYLHASMVWLLAVLGTWELTWQVHLLLGSQGGWVAISRVVMPVILLLLIMSGSRRGAWPLQRHDQAYLGLTALPLVVWLLLWTVLTAFENSGDSWPFPWLPVLNQLDLTMLAAICLPIVWVRRLRCDYRFSNMINGLYPLIAAIIGAVGFIWLNSILARGLHQWAGVGFNLQAMLHSPLAQASVSVFWSLLALVTMIYAVRHSQRTVWVVGAGLLGGVVFKLFMIDLSGHGTVARIVSFVAVGLLLLVIGWFAPVPPKRTV